MKLLKRKANQQIKIVDSPPIRSKGNDVIQSNIPVNFIDRTKAVSPIRNILGCCFSLQVGFPSNGLLMTKNLYHLKNTDQLVFNSPVG
jgi:hypothetical protein